MTTTQQGSNAPIASAAQQAVADLRQPKWATGTTRLYANFWPTTGRPLTHGDQVTSVAFSMRNLAETFRIELTPSMISTYAASLERLSVAQAIQAFSRAQDECKFFPTTAELLALSGSRGEGDPVEREADRALREVLANMREFGWKLHWRITPGSPEILTGEVPEALREYPGWSSLRVARLVGLTLAHLGWGVSERGLLLLVDHPAVQEDTAMQGTSQYRANLLRVADDLGKRWVASWRFALEESIPR